MFFWIYFDVGNLLLVLPFILVRVFYRRKKEDLVIDGATVCGYSRTILAADSNSE